MSDNKPTDAPFALIILTGLRVVRFQTRQEFEDAMLTLRNAETPFVPVKYHHGAGRYVLPDLIDVEKFAF